MSIFELISLICNILFGSGFLLSFLQLKQTKSQMIAETRGKDLENEEKASQIVIEYVVEPLKKEMNSLRRELQRFRKAVEKISSCPMAKECPVSIELTCKQEDNQ